MASSQPLFLSSPPSSMEDLLQWQKKNPPNTPKSSFFRLPTPPFPSASSNFQKLEPQKNQTLTFPNTSASTPKSDDAAISGEDGPYIESKNVRRLVMGIDGTSIKKLNGVAMAPASPPLAPPLLHPIHHFRPEIYNKQEKLKLVTANHLLDCMYHLIVNHTLPIDPSTRMEFSDCITIENVGNNATTKNLDFTKYVDFMCGIVDGDKDVKILCEKKIILGDMEDEEVVKLFNGITRSSVKIDGPKSTLQKTIKKANSHYGKIPKVKVFRSAKKMFLESWKLIVVVFSILSLLLEVYVGVYQCKDHFGLSKDQSVIPYATQIDKPFDF
ncbi:hypothetical protein LXL04_028111 [Taraxacum kok-saghyz]